MDIEKAIKEAKPSMRKMPRNKMVIEGMEVEATEMPKRGDKSRKMMIEGEEYEIAPSPKPKGKMQLLKKGGYVKSADGCAVRGKTKGRMV